MAEYERDPVRLEIYLDDDPEPLGIYRPPATFELDTTRLPDGPHRLFIKAYDAAGVPGVREVPFIVRNGPGIAVVGLGSGDIVEGKIPVLVNAYAGTHDIHWEPTRAETPAPVPTWAWVLFLLVTVWAGYYWFDTGFVPPPEYANSPTFSSPTVIAAAALEGTRARERKLPEFNWAETGARVYAQHCQVCHAAGGEGIPRFVRSLQGNPVVVAADPAESLERILFGVTGPAAAESWKGSMPGFARLTDEEVAAVANLVRTSWGNSAPLVRPEQVTPLRESRPARR